jgi:hypothetical protein
MVCPLSSSACAFFKFSALIGVNVSFKVRILYFYIIDGEILLCKKIPSFYASCTDSLEGVYF